MRTITQSNSFTFSNELDSIALALTLRDLSLEHSKAVSINSQKQRVSRTSSDSEREFAYAPIAGFRSAKAAQIAAHFVSRSGGQIAKLKLAKLIYLAEREHLKRFDRPMTMDECYSLPHGPICSSSLNGIDGKLGDDGEWTRVRAYGRDQVHGNTVGREDLDEITNAEFRVLEHVWDQFGGMTAARIRTWTHDPENVPEYVEVTKSRLPITYEQILRALGKKDAAAIAADIDQSRHLEALCCS